MIEISLVEIKLQSHFYSRLSATYSSLTCVPFITKIIRVIWYIISIQSLYIVQDFITCLRGVPANIGRIQNWIWFPCISLTSEMILLTLGKIRWKILVEQFGSIKLNRIIFNDIISKSCRRLYSVFKAEKCTNVPYLETVIYWKIFLNSYLD